MEPIIKAIDSKELLKIKIWYQFPCWMIFLRKKKQMALSYCENSAYTLLYFRLKFHHFPTGEKCLKGNCFGDKNDLWAFIAINLVYCLLLI